MVKPISALAAASSDLETARRVIETEIDGLMALRASLAAPFIGAVEAIDSMRRGRKGRLIIAGIGKSGHVARKISATLASTGTPSYYVHPGEASHGDMGMITENDVVLMLSNSGENNELTDLMTYTRRFGITLIGMTRNADSSLGKHSDIVLLLPSVPEACPNGLAPTTSTTMMMALGDALAISLLERMGLTAEQFSIFHPGGKLGQRLASVSMIMRKGADLPWVSTKARMDEALLVLTEKNLGCVIISDDRKHVEGIITDGDLKRHMGPDLLQKPVIGIMSRAPRAIAPDALAVEAVKIMTQTPGHYITSLIVTEPDGTIVGLIRLQDCLQAGVV